VAFREVKDQKLTMSGSAQRNLVESLARTLNLPQEVKTGSQSKLEKETEEKREREREGELTG